MSLGTPTTRTAHRQRPGSSVRPPLGAPGAALSSPSTPPGPLSFQERRSAEAVDLVAERDRLIADLDEMRAIWRRLESAA